MKLAFRCFSMSVKDRWTNQRTKQKPHKNTYCNENLPHSIPLVGIRAHLIELKLRWGWVVNIHTCTDPYIWTFAYACVFLPSVCSLREILSSECDLKAFGALYNSACGEGEVNNIASTVDSSLCAQFIELPSTPRSLRYQIAMAVCFCKRICTWEYVALPFYMVLSLQHSLVAISFPSRHHFAFDFRFE